MERVRINDDAPTASTEIQPEEYDNAADEGDAHQTADCRIMIPGTSPGWTSQRTPSVPDSGRGSARQQPVQ